MIDTYFEDKEISDVGMIETRTEYNKLIKIFFIKELDYAMKIMVSWMALDKLEDAKKRRYFIDSSRMK